MPYLHERKIFLNKRINSDQFYSIQRDSESNRMFIFCLNIDFQKLYIYTETGILLARMIYKELAEECGKPIEISDNGKYLIFKKSEVSTEISIIEITFNGLFLIKKIDFKKEINNKI